MKTLNQLFYVLFFSSLIGCSSSISNKSDFQNLNIEISDVESPVTKSIRGISVIDSNTVWLSGAKGTILKSTDGGLTWGRLNSPDEDSLDFRSIHAFSESSAIIVSAGFPARAYKTSNSGESWELVYENQDSAAFMNSIAFKNEKEGVIIGDQLNGRHLLLTTNNGGKIWERVDSSNMPIPLITENAFAASGSCIAISENDSYLIAFGGEKTRVFSSSNGLIWKATETPFLSGTSSSGIYSIASGENNVIGVGGDYTKVDSSYYPVISINNGDSWQKTTGKVDGYRSVIDYCEYGKFWVCGGTNGMEISVNKGAEWTKFSFQNVNTLRFLPNTTKAIAANSKGEIFLINIQLN